MQRYKVIRQFYRTNRKITIAKSYTLAEAQAHCSDPEASSKTAISKNGKDRTRKYGKWFDSYDYM